MVTSECDGMALRELTPWYVRMAAKVVLSRIPVSYQAWRALRLFSHGEMAKSAYAYGVFRQHFDASTFPRKAGGFVALEIGPGDGLLSAVIAAAGATLALLSSDPKRVAALARIFGVTCP